MKIFLISFIHIVFILALSPSSLPQTDETIQGIRALELELVTAPVTRKQEIYKELFQKYQDVNPYIAIAYGDSCLHALYAAGDSAKIHSMLSSTGLYMTFTNRASEGYERLFRAMIYYASVGNDEEMSYVMNNIGLGSHYSGYHTQALEYHQKTLRILQHLSIERTQSISYNNIGLALMALGRYEEALESFRKSYDLKLKYDMQNSALRSLNNIGSVYHKMGLFQKSIEVHDQVLRESRRRKYLGGVPLALEEMARSEIALGRFADAERHIMEAKGIYDSIKSFHGNIDVNMIHAELRVEQQKYPEAVVLLEKAKTYAARAVARGKLRDIHLAISNLYDEMGDTRAALQYHRLYVAYNDSLRSDEVYQKYVEIKANIELARQERRIELLEKDAEIKSLQLSQYGTERWLFLIALLLGIMVVIYVTIKYRIIARLKQALEENNEEIRKQKEALDESNAAKDRFFSILAHDLRSPFQATLGLSDMLMKEATTLSPEKIQRFSTTINTVLHRQYNYLDNLLTWSRLQLNKFELKIESVELGPLVKSAAEMLEQNAITKGINLRTENLNGEVITTDRYILGTVVTNLISNAIKFTHPEGEVVVRIEADSDTTSITVEDNGVGIDAERLSQLFHVGKNISTDGTGKEKGTGLGLIICKEMIEKIGGELVIDSEEGKGTACRIVIPSSPEGDSPEEPAQQ